MGEVIGARSLRWSFGACVERGKRELCLVLISHLGHISAKMTTFGHCRGGNFGSWTVQKKRRGSVDFRVAGSNQFIRCSLY